MHQWENFYIYKDNSSMRLFDKYMTPQATLWAANCRCAEARPLQLFQPAKSDWLGVRPSLDQDMVRGAPLNREKALGSFGSCVSSCHPRDVGSRSLS
jgi:hypothetical protein